MTGRVIGRAASSLRDAGGWARNASAVKAGTWGEQRTEKALNALASGTGGIAVLHDLRQPLRGIEANIDHVVVTGRRVIVVDSKTWKPGIYWTWRERNFRGRNRVPYTESAEAATAAMRLQTHLGPLGAELAEPLTVIWPSTAEQRLTLLGFRVPGSRVIRGDRFAAAPHRALRIPPSPEPADPRIVDRLAALVVSK